MTVNELTTALESRIHPRYGLEQVVLVDGDGGYQTAALTVRLKDYGEECPKRIRAYVGPFVPTASVEHVFQQFVEATDELVRGSFPFQGTICPQCNRDLLTSIKCKQTCPKCGYVESCEDLCLEAPNG